MRSEYDQLEEKKVVYPQIVEEWQEVVDTWKARGSKKEEMPRKMRGVMLLVQQYIAVPCAAGGAASCAAGVAAPHPGGAAGPYAAGAAPPAGSVGRLRAQVVAPPQQQLLRPEKAPLSACDPRHCCDEA